MQPRFHIVMFHPEIPHNTGAAGRLALATGSRLHLIKPLGFSLDEKHVRRTGLDYWAKVDLHVWDSLEELKQAAAPGAQFWYLSTKAPRSHWDAVFHAGDYLVFGPESRGLPESMLREHADTALTIPMPGEGARSLNLSTAELSSFMKDCARPAFDEPPACLSTSAWMFCGFHHQRTQGHEEAGSASFLRQGHTR